MKAGKTHVCAGIAIRRGERPGRLADVWMIGRSRRCADKIKTGEYYVSNRNLPARLLALIPMYDQRWPTCLFCAIETYPEFFEGPLVAQYLRPMTPKRRDTVQRGLVNLLADAREMAVIADEVRPERR